LKGVAEVLGFFIDRQGDYRAILIEVESGGTLTYLVSLSIEQYVQVGS
jgi:hypothetical protein